MVLRFSTTNETATYIHRLFQKEDKKKIFIVKKHEIKLYIYVLLIENRFLSLQLLLNYAL